MLTDFVKRAFIIIFSAVAFGVLFWFLFGNPFHTLDPSWSARTSGNYSGTSNTWMGAIYYVCEGVETPMSSHYYDNIYVPNVHTFDDMDSQLSTLSTGTDSNVHQVGLASDSFKGTYTDLSTTNDNSITSTISNETYSTGWK